ncbi:hypothetical protein OVA24_17560 [Luteolibacter sp. SL250]|uniref:hypothetical protein n=1 Tax=Luteolibacter sp. SL250 TaxID=2995170 RepID=UPI002270AAEC|nr:hypothetical protein [Luteolibacter sp. SL250]WAC19037.1 hypothetical protein OVA24_17560 [Luteolibacter sp. SL250]
MIRLLEKIRAMKDHSTSLLLELESAFSKVRDLIELNEALVEGEVATIKECTRGDAIFTDPSGEGSIDLIDALRNQRSVEWEDVTSTIEMALIRGRAEGASSAVWEISVAVQNWWSARDPESR